MEVLIHRGAYFWNFTVYASCECLILRFEYQIPEFPEIKWFVRSKSQAIKNSQAVIKVLNIYRYTFRGRFFLTKIGD